MAKYNRIKSSITIIFLATLTAACGVVVPTGDSLTELTTEHEEYDTGSVSASADTDPDILSSEDSSAAEGTADAADYIDAAGEITSGIEQSGEESSDDDSLPAEGFDDEDYEEIVAPAEIAEEVPDVYYDEELIYDNGILFHKDVSESNKKIFYKYFDMEPEEMKRALDAYDVLIVVGPDGRYTGGNAGLYYAEERILAINGSSEDRIKMSVNHEIGHCVDSMVGELLHMPVDKEKYWLGVSNLDAFEQIYREEVKNAGYPSWNSTDTYEFFAETYRYVIEDNEYMMKKAPRSAEFVKDVIDHFYPRIKGESE